MGRKRCGFLGVSGIERGRWHGLGEAVFKEAMNAIRGTAGLAGRLVGELFGFFAVDAGGAFVDNRIDGLGGKGHATIHHE